MATQTTRRQRISAMLGDVNVFAPAYRSLARRSRSREELPVRDQPHAHSISVAGAICTILLSAGCDRPSVLQPDTTPAFERSIHAHSAHDELLRSVRQATARFHSTTQALKAGYEPTSHCVAVPALGGMGYHWMNPGLINPTFDPLRPEALLYASKENGKLELVGVEYIVRNIGQEHPSFGGHPFDVGGVGPLQRDGVAHWSLHVWLYEENPAGLFAPFNPNITCP